MEKSKGKKLKIVLIVVFLSLCTAPIYLNTLVVFSRNLFAPRTKHFDNSKPQLLYEFPGVAYEMSWEDDSSQIKVYIHNWTNSNYDVPDTIAYVNIKTNEIIFQEEDKSLNPAYAPMPEELERQGFDDDYVSWALCPDLNLLVAAGGFAGEQYWLKYWKNDELINTFYFSSKQWSNNEYHPPLALLEFTPSCNVVVLQLFGWIFTEGEGKRELWLLDIPTEAFGRHVVGKSPPIKLWDYPVQDVKPNWSPDEEEFVFGGGEFGIEIYDVTKSKRRLLIGPQYELYDSLWSPTGKWIAAKRYGDVETFDRLYIFSSDGSLHTYTDVCDRTTDYLWSPNEEKIAILCHGDCDRLCPESCESLCGNDCDDPCENPCPDSDYLWVWDLE